MLRWLEPLPNIHWSDDANQVLWDDNAYLTANQVFSSGRQFVMLWQMSG